MKEGKRKWLESTNFRCIALAGLTFILFIVSLIVFKPDSIASVFLINIFSIICTASVSYWLASISYNKQIKSFAQSAMNHLKTVSSNIDEIHKRIEQETSNLNKSDLMPNKDHMIGVLENLSSMTNFLQSHIDLGANNWVSVLAEEIEFYKEEILELIEIEKQDRQKQIGQLDSQKDDDREEIAKLRKEIKELQEIRTNAVISMSPISAAPNTLSQNFSREMSWGDRNMFINLMAASLASIPSEKLKALMDSQRDKVRKGDNNK